MGIVVLKLRQGNSYPYYKLWVIHFSLYYLPTGGGLHWRRYGHTSYTFIPPPGGELLCYICVCAWRVGVWVSTCERLPSPPRCISTHTQLELCCQWQEKLNKYCRLVHFYFHWWNEWRKLKKLITLHIVHIHITTNPFYSLLIFVSFLLHF